MQPIASPIDLTQLTHGIALGPPILALVVLLGIGWVGWRAGR